MHKFWVYSCSNAVLVGGTMYSWTDTTASQQLATTLMNAKDNFISQAVDPVIALLPVCMYIANHTTIDLSHWKVAVRYYLQLGVYLQACQPSYPKNLETGLPGGCGSNRIACKPHQLQEDGWFQARKCINTSLCRLHNLCMHSLVSWASRPLP